MELNYNITYRQKDKGWQFIISYKLNGKWKQKSKQGFKTKKEAKPVAEQMVLELKRQFKNEDSILDIKYDSITFKQLSDIYIEHISLYRENNTIQAYKYAFNKFKGLNPLKVKDIKKMHVQRIVDNIFKAEEIEVHTIATYIQRIKSLLNYYVDNYDSSYVIFNKIKLPEIKTRSQHKKALTKSELDYILSKLKEKNNKNYYIIALIAGTCGLRCGEILGLTWNDVDFKNSTLDINKQWKIDKKSRTNTFGALKSKNSYRIVPVPPSTLKELIEYKKISVTDINNRIVPCSNGFVKRFLNPVLTETADICLHELRHTYATLLISNGVDFKTAAQLLGHDVQQTLKTYSHVTEDMLSRATQSISKIF